VDGSGNVYVADFGNSIIRKINPSGTVSTLAGTAKVVGVVDESANTASFVAPQALAVDGTGNLYIADSASHTIRKITSSGFVSTLAGTPGVPGYVDGIGAGVKFKRLSSIAVDITGNIYVADSEAHAIRKISPSGVVANFAGTPGISGKADGPGTIAKFNLPSGIALDGTGNVYVSDTYNYTIRKITPDGIVSTVAGAAGISGNVDGDANASRLGAPGQLVLDRSGNIFVSDGFNSTIRKITPSGTMSTFAGRFTSPGGLSLDQSGNLYVADSYRQVIQKVSPAGVITPVAGSTFIKEAQTDRAFRPNLISPTTLRSTAKAIFTLRIHLIRPLERLTFMAALALSRARC